MFKQFVEPYLVDEKMRHFSEQNDANLDQIARSFLLISMLSKTAKNKIFLRNLRDAGVSTRPRQLDKFEKQYFNAQQLATDKQLVQSLEDFSPVLQVLYHTMANLVRVQDIDQVNITQQLNSLSVQTSDLVVILLEYFGKLSQPRHDLYEKVTGLQPTPVEQAKWLPYSTRAGLCYRRSPQARPHVSACVSHAPLQPGRRQAQPRQSRWQSSWSSRASSWQSSPGNSAYLPAPELDSSCHNFCREDCFCGKASQYPYPDQGPTQEWRPRRPGWQGGQSLMPNVCASSSS